MRSGQNHKGSIRRLNFSYSLAILSIALLALASQVTTDVFIRRHAALSQILSAASYERTTGVRVVNQTHFVSRSGTAEERKQRTQRYQHTVRELQSYLDDLHVYSQRFYGEEGLTQSVVDVRPAAKALTDASRAVVLADPDISDEQMDRLMHELQEKSLAFRAAMNQLVSRFESDNLHHVETAEVIHLGLMLAMLVLLLVQAVVIFRPAMRELESSVQQLEDASDAIATQEELLRKQNEKLQMDHALLQESTESLEAANQRIEAAAKRFEELFQGLPIACFGYDEQGTIFEWNRACEHMFGLTAGDMFMRTVYDVLGTSEQKSELHEIVRRVFKGQAVERIEWEQRGYSGGIRYLLCSTFPIHGPNNKVGGAIFSCVDLTAQKLYEQQIEDHRNELQQANERLESLASTDGLTGLRNHRAFQEALAKEISRSKREKRALSLVLLDVDHFKKYNDAYGHPAGDQVLKEVARILSECGRDSDVVARYGGEEFVVILPGADEPGALLMAERMRSSIEMTKVDGRKVTASFGVATYATGDGAATLIQAADKALYASKEEGRNRVTHATTLSQSSAA